MLELDHTTTPTTVNPLGVKGVGEAGTIGSTPAIAAAVADALGVPHIDMPMQPEKLWKIIHQHVRTNFWMYGVLVDITPSSQ